MKRLIATVTSAAVAALGLVAVAAPAQANPTHTHCSGTAVQVCVTFQERDGKVRATSKVTDRTANGRFRVATTNTKVQYKGWDRTWHTYGYPAGDYDGWKGNYDTSATGWMGRPCQGTPELRAVTTAKYRAGGPTYTTVKATSSHYVFC